MGISTWLVAGMLDGASDSMARSRCAVMLRPGIRVTTSANDYQPIKQLFLIQFDGKDWVPLGKVIGY